MKGASSPMTTNVAQTHRKIESVRVPLVRASRRRRRNKIHVHVPRAKWHDDVCLCEEVNWAAERRPGEKHNSAKGSAWWHIVCKRKREKVKSIQPSSTAQVSLRIIELFVQLFTRHGKSDRIEWMQCERNEVREETRRRKDHCKATFCVEAAGATFDSRQLMWEELRYV